MTILTPNLPDYADDQWLGSLPDCTMLQFRKKIALGGVPVFQLDETSRQMAPVWRLLVRDAAGRLWRVRTPSDPVARRLVSVRQVYQIARNLGLHVFELPVDQGRR